MAHLEIAVESLDDALKAASGGARSLEITVDLANGGLTPPIELVKAVKQALTIEAHAMVRPYAHSFAYTQDDDSHIFDAIQQFKNVGVTGIVFGAVDANNQIDLALMRRVIEAASPLKVTLHRALDTSANPDQTLEALRPILPRVLSSGPAPSAWEGRETLTRWVQTFPEYEFVLSGGITAEQLSELVSTVRAHVYHIGGAARTQGVVDVEKVRQLAAVINAG